MTPSLRAIRLSLWLRDFRLGQGLDRLKSHWQEGNGPSHWRGMQMFLDHQVRRDDEDLALVYRHFRDNITDIFRLAAASNVPVLLCTVAVN